MNICRYIITTSRYVNFHSIQMNCLRICLYKSHWSNLYVQSKCLPIYRLVRIEASVIPETLTTNVSAQNAHSDADADSEETFRVLYQALLTLLTGIVTTQRKTATVRPLLLKDFAYKDIMTYFRHAFKSWVDTYNVNAYKVAMQT